MNIFNLPWVRILVAIPGLLGMLWLLSSGLKGIAHEEWLRATTPLMMLLCSLGFTALIQSSSFTTLLLITMVASGAISLEAGIAGVLGANLGTCVTAAIGTIPFDINAKRLALSHIIFNTGGIIIAYPLIGCMAKLIRMVIK